MMGPMHRRAFLETSARLFVVTAVAAGLPACGDETAPAAEPVYDGDARLVFPQGLASGDPTPDSVVLWTRVEPKNVADAPPEIEVSYEVASDPDFRSVVAEGKVVVEAASDHTLRLEVNGLLPYRHYFYRFVALGARTDAGRTKTAPLPDEDVAVRFAFASCQDFNGRYFHGWETMANDDAVAPIDFVLFLGDYIYETAADPRFQDEVPGRSITIADGLVIDPESGAKAALTLSDYRSLYKQYRSDEHLRRAHALFPFVCIWDDHEFADDSWQDHATHFNELMGDEKDSSRRSAANRAWFEFLPSRAVYREGADFPGDLRIYRSLRFGKHVDLLLTDQRSYRDDHLVPEGPKLDAVGKIGENTALGSRNFLVKETYDQLEAAASVSLLGAEQREWFIGALNQATATWKLWASSTQVAQMAVDLTPFADLPPMFRKAFYFSVDQWDGYRSERAALLRSVAEAGQKNLIVLSGDIHAFYASQLYVDFDAPAEAVGVEFVVGALSSTPVQEITKRTIAGSPTLTALGLADLVPQFDELLGAASPHYVYRNSQLNGFAIAEVNALTFEVELVQLDGVTDLVAPTPKRVRFRVAAGSNTLVRV
ncbi:MAG: hypothetical protein EXR76_09610 [Myxococcales bacterium]|nr:hypothetical protein [Myxococcales bacterium]